jgi:hypothetical protein
LFFLSQNILSSQGATLSGIHKVLFPEVTGMTSNQICCSNEQNQQPFLTEAIGESPTPHLKRWSFNALIGTTIGGAGTTWKRILRDNNFNDAYVSWWSNDVKDHPYSRNAKDFQFSLNYRYRPQGSYGSSFGRSNSGEVIGYNDAPFNNTELKVNYEMWSISVYHQWFLKSTNNLNFYAGLSLNQAKLSFDAGIAVPQATTTYQAWKPGLTIGFQLPIFENTNTYIRTNLAYNYLPPLKTNPFVMLAYEYDDDGRHEYLKTAIPATSARLSSFSLGILFGVRMGSTK